MTQRITEIISGVCGPVVVVTGGRVHRLTAANLARVRRAIPARTDTPIHAETGLRYSGPYYTVVHVIGDDWDDDIIIHTTEV